MYTKSQVQHLTVALRHLNRLWDDLDGSYALQEELNLALEPLYEIAKIRTTVDPYEVS